jgi:four helix bundle protein
MTEELKARSKRFATNIFKHIDNLPRNKGTDVISYQLLKSASSVAANYRSACRSKSHSDFLNKLRIVTEEADETLFWLEFLRDLDYFKESAEHDSLITEARELLAIFAASVKTAAKRKP